MDNRELEYKIDGAIGSITPDVFQRVKDNKNKKMEGNVIPMTQKTKKMLPYSLMGVAAALTLVVGGFGYQSNFMEYTVVGIDVNPSVELSVNKQDKILSATAVNEDGAAILSGMDLKNVDTKIAVNAIIGAMVQQGYMDKANNDVLITVKNDDAEKVEKIKEELSQEVKTTLASEQITPVIVSQTMNKSEDKDIRALSKILGVSYGKAKMLSNLVEDDKNMTIDKLLAMSADDIEDYYDDMFDEVENEALEKEIDDIFDGIEDKDDLDDDDDKDDLDDDDDKDDLDDDDDKDDLDDDDDKDDLDDDDDKDDLDDDDKDDLDDEDKDDLDDDDDKDDLDDDDDKDDLDDDDHYDNIDGTFDDIDKDIVHDQDDIDDTFDDIDDVENNDDNDTDDDKDDIEDDDKDDDN